VGDDCGRVLFFTGFGAEAGDVSGDGERVEDRGRRFRGRCGPTQVFLGGKLVCSRAGRRRKTSEARLGATIRMAEDRTATANDVVKFASYVRDSISGLDYANQRYYGFGVARFATPDPYQASGGHLTPGSWKPIYYTRGDPIGRLSDPQGRETRNPDGIDGACVGYAEAVGSGSNGGGQMRGEPEAEALAADLDASGYSRRPSLPLGPEDPDASPDCLSRDEEKPECTIGFATRGVGTVWVLGFPVLFAAMRMWLFTGADWPQGYF